ncbi:hypothetical protein ACTIVE_9052 [Actinomadura verrucosospora]|uniref:Uncharacterized protein n=1 Tax=Actinomadura verrucosospora TaxID=46165 RepID=A0A7D3ZLS5_ACTVE|nr:hypothetical protein ACTIVE_9052 [Actinomadura verrucosospora]
MYRSPSRTWRQGASADLRGSGRGPVAASAGAALKEITPAAAVQPSSPQVQRTISLNMSVILGSARKRVIFAPGDRVGHRRNADRSQFGYGALTIARTRVADRAITTPRKCAAHPQSSGYNRPNRVPWRPPHLGNEQVHPCEPESKVHRPLPRPIPLKS